MTHDAWAFRVYLAEEHRRRRLMPAFSLSNSITKLSLRPLVESRTAQPAHTLAIPFRVRIGVTGHRALDDEESVRRRVREVLAFIEAGILAESSTTPVVYTIVTALAEGADRLVANVVLERDGAELEAVLPLPRSDYKQDFATEESRHEFDELLRRAVQPPDEPEHHEPRPAAYGRAGRGVLDRIDVLIAVWDHQPPRGEGGTAYVVDLARQQGVPTFIVSTLEPAGIELPTLPPRRRRTYASLARLDMWLGRQRDETRVEVLAKGYHQLDTFNRERLAQSRTTEAEEGERHRLAPLARGLGIDESFADWSLATFVRADILAGLYQWVYTRIAFAVFMFAASAVAVASAVEIFAPEHRHLILFEVGLMLLVVGSVGFALWKRPHDRWISYRSLAENLRSAPFIAILGGGEAAGEWLPDPFAPWFQRAFTELWARRPQELPVPDDASPLCKFLDSAWISGQLSYHGRTSDQFKRHHRVLTSLIDACFLGTFVAALMDAFSLLDTRLLPFLAITLPAFGAAFGGYRELRQYAVHAGRSRRTEERLRRIRARMTSEQDPRELRTQAASAYSVMLEENLDWFGVLEFQELELVT